MHVETGITANQIISELSKSPHGALGEYVPTCKVAATEKPELLARLIAWNRVKGQVRDSKVALPVISLSVESFNDAEFVDNSLAHIASLGPRELVRALRFSIELRLPGRMRAIRRVVERYLRHREAKWPKWERMALQHRGTLRELYALAHIKPCEAANIILYGRSLDKTKFGPPAGSVFEIVARLKDMSPLEAAGQIMEWKIPFLVAMGALGAKAKDPDLVLALIGRMTPTELVTNTKMLQRLGVEKNPALRAAFQEAIGKAAGSSANVLKTSRAAEALEDNDELSEKLKGLQEKQIEKLGGIEGNWLVLADKSGSMTAAIDIARQVSAILSKAVKGRVHLVFFDSHPRSFEVTGKTYDEIQEITRRVSADGQTSIGCGLQWALDSKTEVDGIAIVSDGGENHTPLFYQVYPRYCQFVGKDVPVYFYRTHRSIEELSDSLRLTSIDFQMFETLPGVDYYSVANLCATMRTARFGLVDEIMSARLLKLDEVLPVAA